MQEWTALRLQGIQTPQVTVWQRMPIRPARTFANTRRIDAIYNYVLNVYNSPFLQDVRPPSSLLPLPFHRIHYNLHNLSNPYIIFTARRILITSYQSEQYWFPHALTFLKK